MVRAAALKWVCVDPVAGSAGGARVCGARARWCVAGRSGKGAVRGSRRESLRTAGGASAGLSGRTGSGVCRATGTSTRLPST